MRLYLHIGTEKTGTTSLQAYLNQNRGLFENEGFYVPNSLGRGNHRWLPVLAYNADRTDEFTMEHRLNDPAVRQEKLQQKRQEFEAELATVSQSNVIMTSEHLHSRLTDLQEIQSLHAILKDLFSTITVIVYLRDPFGMAVSLYSTALRAGGLSEDVFDPDSEYMRYSADYERALKMWSSVFGKNHVIPRIYDKACLFGGDIISDFSHFLQVNPEGYIRPDTKNPSLSAFALNVLLSFNHVIDKLDVSRDTAKNMRERLIPILETEFADLPKFHGTYNLQSKYEEAFCAQNEWVRQTYFPKREYLFKKTPATEKNAEALMIRQAVAVARAMYQIMSPK